MKYVFNLQNICIVKVQATGVPYSVPPSPPSNVFVVNKKELFDQYLSCKSVSRLFRPSHK